MPCYHPITAWRSLEKNISGKRPLVFDENKGLPFSKLQVPCGRCIGCRLDRSASSAVRGYHELMTCGEQNCFFLTLTYDNEHLPINNSICTRDLQLFWKRLRKSTGAKFKYIACAEYGAKFSRPHYHACVFGFRLPDEDFAKPPVAPASHSGFPNFQSDVVRKCWPLGLHVINNVSFNSVAYVARYILKKTLGDGESGYIDEDGVYREKEKSYWSAGIGLRYFEKYWSDFYSLGACQVEKTNRLGESVKKSFPIPRYYDKKLEERDPAFFASVKEHRVQVAKSLVKLPKYQPAALAMSEMCRKIRIDKSLSRPLEEII